MLLGAQSHACGLKSEGLPAFQTIRDFGFPKIFVAHLISLQKNGAVTVILLQQAPFAFWSYVMHSCADLEAVY